MQLAKQTKNVKDVMKEKLKPLGDEYRIINSKSK